LRNQHNVNWNYFENKQNNLENMQSWKPVVNRQVCFQINQEFVWLMSYCNKAGDRWSISSIPKGWSDCKSDKFVRAGIISRSANCLAFQADWRAVDALCVVGWSLCELFNAIWIKETFKQWSDAEFLIQLFEWEN